MYKLWYDLSLHQDARDLLAETTEFIGPRENPNPENRLAEIEEADAAFIGAVFPASTTATYERAQKLKVLIRMGIGYDSVDLDMATDYGICVLNTPDAPTEPTAEMAIALILNLARPIIQTSANMKAGQWASVKNQMGFELAGKTLGLVGLGRIGGRVAEIANVFGMKVIAYDPFIDAEKAKALGVELVGQLADLYRVSDFISLHLPSLPETKGMINSETLAQMKRGAYLVNVARGAIVVEEDLAEALRSGQLAGAGLDVWDIEPTSPDNPLCQMENVIATPHIAGACREMLQKACTTAANALLMIYRDELPPNLLNPQVWEKRRRFE